MTYSKEKMTEFTTLLDRHTPIEGINRTSLSHVATYRESVSLGRYSLIYNPVLIILGQGSKRCYLNGKTYDYSTGNYLSLFLPMPLQVEAIDISLEEPLLMVGINIDLMRIANVLLKINSVEHLPAKANNFNPSAITVEHLRESLLEPVIRLLRTLDSPLEQAVLSDSILDEIYFRLLINDCSGSLQRLLQQHGRVQQISKAVAHIHHELDWIVSVDELAEMVNMSTSSFRKIFREVMHMPPLQYAKAIKLDRAQALIRDGRNASEAGYMVGYNSPAQFSREYKRHFGYSPSATRLRTGRVSAP